MNKIFYSIVTTLLLTLQVNAKTNIEVISRFEPQITSAIFAQQILKTLNSSQDEYEFKFSVTPGSAGEAADQRAIKLARAGREVIVFGSDSSLGINRYTFGPTFDREKDLIPILGLVGGPFAVFVKPNSDINSIAELINKLKTKEQIFFANTTSSASSKFFGAIFTKNSNLNNVKMLNYEKSGDLILNVSNGEADYAVYPLADAQSSLKPIMISSKSRLNNLSDVPTGIELGYKDFSYNTLTLFSVPKEQEELGRKIQEIFMQACLNDSILKELAKDNMQILYCFNKQQIFEKVQSDINIIEKYPDFKVYLK